MHVNGQCTLCLLLLLAILVWLLVLTRLKLIGMLMIVWLGLVLCFVILLLWTFSSYAWSLEIENWVSWIWRPFIQPSKSLFFWWLFFYHCVQTNDALCRRGFQLVFRCLYKFDVETVNHLFLPCPFASAVWQYLYNLFGISFVTYGYPLIMFQQTSKVSKGWLFFFQV